MNRLAYVLEKIKSINDKYNEIDKINGVNFNIFSILDMERKEVKTHSNFIYELLNSNGLHGKGDIFLKLFFQEVLNLDYDIETRVQPVIQEDSTTENRRIDFTISTKNYEIGIEIKIDAKDQKHQLYDYSKEIDERVKKSKKSAELHYLTLDGKEPSIESVSKNGDTLNSSKYKRISFKLEIINWIKECIKESATNTTVREALIQYLNLINKITNNLNSQGRKKEMTELLNGENLKIYLEAENAMIETKIKLQLNFWYRLQEALKNNELLFEFYFGKNKSTIEDAVNNFYTGPQNKRDYGLKLYLDDKEDIFMSIDIYEKLYYNIMSEKENTKYFEEIKSLYEWYEADEYIFYIESSETLNFYDFLDTNIIFKFLDTKEVSSDIINGIVNDIKQIEVNVKKIINRHKAVH